MTELTIQVPISLLKARLDLFLFFTPSLPSFHGNSNGLSWQMDVFPEPSQTIHQA
jgi:hypothetical protein